MRGMVALLFFLVPFLNDLCCRIEPMGMMLFGSSGLTVTGFLVFAAISSATENLLLVSILVLGLVYGIMVGLTGSHMYIFVADLFPTSVRALGFGVSFNLAFAILGGARSGDLAVGMQGRRKHILLYQLSATCHNLQQSCCGMPTLLSDHRSALTRASQLSPHMSLQALQDSGHSGVRCPANIVQDEGPHIHKG
ncbi:proP [Symbiodinium natans]|uniref:ProP protein n=1 Tax=Symbiodinium natans TaxID=878477 RepID=A0A812TM54_9DINO|nr:proP [Symbiodinium natans]